MNERIKELIQQMEWEEVGADLYGKTFDGCMTGEALQKFAEVIVRECVGQLELVRKYRYDRVQPLENQQTIIDECQYQIKQHFGVEE